MASGPDSQRPSSPLQSDKAQHEDTVSANDEVQKSTLRNVALIAGCTLGNLAAVSGSAIQMALPRIAQDLDIPQPTLQWPIAAYGLTAGCFLLLMGRLADIYGRKLGFLYGTLWYTIWSIASGFAQSEIQLDLFRAFQGIGVAAIIPSAIGILAQEFHHGKYRSIAFATFSCGAPVGGSIGILVGGTVTQLAPTSWRALFWILAALATFGAILVLLTVPKDVRGPDTDRRVDWLGAFIVTVALVCILFVLAQGEVAPNGWKTGYIIALLIVGVLGLFVFAAWQHYLETKTTFPPLMRLTLWKRANGKFAVVQLVGFFAWIGFASFLYWATLYCQVYLGLSPVKAMIRFIPMFISGALCNVVIAIIIGRVSGSIILTVGCAATGVGCLLYAIIDTNASYWAFGFPAAAIVVFGADFIFATGSIFIAKVALPHEQSLAGGVFQTLMQVGGSVGLAITAVVADQVTVKESRKLGVEYDPRNASGPPAPKEALLKGYRAAQWTDFAFCMLALVLVVVFLRGLGRVGRPPKESDEDHHSDEEKQSTGLRRTSSETVNQQPPEKQA